MRSITFQRTLDRVVGIFICSVLSFFYRMRRKRSVVSEPENILIILLSEMGSLVLAYPMFEYIRKKFPDASIYVLLFEKNAEILEMLEVIPPENILRVSDRSLFRLLKDIFFTMRTLKKLKCDAVIDCELFARISSIISYFSGASIRVGFHPHTQEGLYRGNFINHPVLYNPYHHISEQFVTLVDAIESKTLPKAKRIVHRKGVKPPKVVLKEDELKDMRRRLYNDFPGLKEREIVLIHPGGGRLPIRAWPSEYYLQVAESLLVKGYAIAMIGLEEDNKVAQSIVNQLRSPHSVNLNGYTKSIRELMMLFHISSLLITNDGGPGHFAAMTPIPTIVLYGPETPVLYGPIDDKATIFYTPLSCSPCVTAYNHRNSPCDGDNLCLKHIQPEEVFAKALEILRDQKSHEDKMPV